MFSSAIDQLQFCCPRLPDSDCMQFGKKYYIYTRTPVLRI